MDVVIIDSCFKALRAEPYAPPKRVAFEAPMSNGPVVIPAKARCPEGARKDQSSPNP